ncbi:hypothetical protein BGW38_005141 [Lunasporangiospora selenospora]|uniref:Uncharacterized protein n=1 Tax=Lunasporangiospora selenospora TaxID=979761 RepID=A0A9P6KBN6_9FUNG|nr:hypothetical protein BGW38_005141 [Lunasporangiospora selenospora]
MNDGFKDARELLTPTWIQFKLSYVEEAEAIAYNIPGFREADGKRLPKEIYYTATLQQKKDYEKRFQKDQQEKQIEFLMAAYKELKRAQSQAPAVYPGV